jgi:hypothetical protein
MALRPDLWEKMAHFELSSLRLGPESIIRVGGAIRGSKNEI